jgi:hypothetical protein
MVSIDSQSTSEVVRDEMLQTWLDETPSGHNSTRFNAAICALAAQYFFCFSGMSWDEIGYRTQMEELVPGNLDFLLRENIPTLSRI